MDFEEGALIEPASVALYALMREEFTPEQFEKILRKEISITGSWMSYSAPFPGKAWNLSTRFLAEKRIRADILISHRFNICQIRKAFEVMADSSVFSEKVMILF